MLCRTVNRLFSVPLLNRIAPAPAVDDRTDMIEFLQRSFISGNEFLDEFAPLNEIEGKRVLDVGCGLGSKTVAMAASGAAEVVGVDTDPEKIHWARILAVEAGIANVSFAA
jgi:2-polyprenyl-3-methyl-5-hydroxy-6-metoxy-1,4-benzoquinol methylase